MLGSLCYRYGSIAGPYERRVSGTPKSCNWTDALQALVSVGFRCVLDPRKYRVADRNGSLPEEETQAPVLHFCAASITLCDHFWGATFSAGAQRPSSWVKKPSFESGARN